MTDKQALRYLSPVKTLMKRLDFDKHYIEALETAMQALKDKGKTEVLQGEWIEHTDGYFTVYTCNKCNGIVGENDKFCGHCGAEKKTGGADND